MPRDTLTSPRHAARRVTLALWRGGITPRGVAHPSARHAPRGPVSDVTGLLGPSINSCSFVAVVVANGARRELCFNETVGSTDMKQAALALAITVAVAGCGKD